MLARRHGNWIGTNTRHINCFVRVLLIVWGAFGPGKAYKVEKQSSRGVAYLHRCILVCFYLLCISTPVCSLLMLVCESITLLVLLIFGWLPHRCALPEAVYPDILVLIVLYLRMTRPTSITRDLTWYRAFYNIYLNVHAVNC